METEDSTIKMFKSLSLKKSGSQDYLEDNLKGSDRNSNSNQACKDGMQSNLKYSTKDRLFCLNTKIAMASSQYT